MNRQDLEQILASLPSRKVAVIGDGCIDVYWEADMRLSELSREVPHYPLPIVKERFSLGACANVVANLATLGVKDIRYVSCIGDDWRGVIFRSLLDEIQVPDHYLICSKQRVTPAYCKPIRRGISDVCYEDPRLDFNNQTPLSEELEQQLMERLEEAVDGADILVVCDQLKNGCLTERLIEKIEQLGKTMPVIVDSRDRIGRFRNVMIKPNEVETCHCLGISEESAADLETMKQAAAGLEKRNGKPVLVTLGAQGVLWSEDQKVIQVPAYQVMPPIDFVGAGDAFLAGFSAVYSLDVCSEVKLSFANLVPAVTIRKIGTTGTACPEELRKAYDEYDSKDQRE
ncbi:MAG: bifunctional heptose 7-phosphate kinase/heptose 1-phosphate adenyltransferase [Massiliimalia sp.]|jgi:rfaE bifunctional protein kinase chain/domain